jgi:flagellar motor switch protein FliG
MPNKEYQISSRKFFPTRYKAGIRPLRTSDRGLRDTKKALTGKQKAAMLLMSLDTATASELLKGVDAKVVQELAAELAHLDAADSSRNRQSLKLARQFCNSLQPNHGFRLKGFLKALLKSTVGEEKTEQIQTGIQELLYKDDPFISIRSADSQTVATILENEHPQTAAVVLSELPAEKNSEVLSFLDWGIRISVVNRMSSCGVMSAEAKMRTAEVVCRRLEAIAAPVLSCESKKGGPGGPLPTLVAAKAEAAAGQSEPSLRKLAVVLRNLGKEIRDGLLGAIQGKNRQAGETVADLMIVWEDIPQIADRSLKEALRRIDVSKLGLALVKADDRFFRKIKSNISEPMAVMLEEEAIFMSAYKKKDVEEAREEIVRVLREMNERGEIAFIEEECNA